MGVWQGVATDSLKYHPGPPSLTLLRPAVEPPLKRPFGRFRGGPPTGWVACGCLLPFWTPHVVRLRLSLKLSLIETGSSINTKEMGTGNY
jgi:hypothetical protein